MAEYPIGLPVLPALGSLEWSLKRVAVVTAKQKQITVAVAIPVIATVCFLLAGRVFKGERSASELLADAQKSLSLSNFETAIELAGRIPEDSVESIRGRLVVAESLLRMEEQAQAMQVLRSIPRDGSNDSVASVFMLAEILRDSGQLSKAIDSYLAVLRDRPNYELVHQRLALLYGMTGQRWEALPHLLWLARAGTIGLQELAVLGDLNRPLEFRDTLEAMRQQNPDDALVALGLGGVAWSEGRPVEAEEVLVACLKIAPSLTPAHAMLGEIIIDDRLESLRSWNAALPEDADLNPDIWLVRGLWFRSCGKLPVSARCLLQALQLEPAHRRASYQLGLVLQALGHEAAARFSDRAALLSELTSELDKTLRSDGQDELAVHRVVSILEQTGRYLEAIAWCRVAGPRFPSSAWPRETYDRLIGLADPQTPRTIASRNPALLLDVSDFPSPDALLTKGVASPDEDAPAGTPRATIRFHEETQVGIDFVYDNGADPSTPGARTFEQTGGGVAVIDFDCDAWPDLFFSQGGVRSRPYRERSVSCSERIVRLAVSQCRRAAVRQRNDVGWN